MGDAAALDPLTEVNPYTGEAPSDQLSAASGQPAPPTHARVASDEDFERLPAGATFVDPEGNVRKKPLPTVANERDFDALPEGADFLDPEGNQRKKPAYEPLNYTAQTLHSMAINPKEQRKALEYAYPGAKIVDTPDGPVVNDNGVMRKAGMTRGVRPFLGGLTAGVLPTTGAVLGAMGGGVAAAPTGPGAVAGVAAGGASGGIAGQMANDAIFHAIAGSDRTPGEELTNLGLAGLTSAAGAGVGRGAAAFVPSIKAGASAASAAVPGALRAFTGATAERLEQAESLGNRGYAVTPSASFPRAAHLQNQVEVLDPAFRTDKPLVQQNRAAYEKEAGGILKEAGVPEFNTVDEAVKPPSLTSPTAAIPTARVGEALQQSAMQQAQAADARVQQLFEQRRQALAQGLPEQQSQREAILQAQAESKRAVENLLNQNYANINRDVERAYQLSGTGANSGEAWQVAAENLRNTRQAIGARATRMYEDSHALGGDTRISSQPLTEAARQVAEQLPEEFRTTQPAVVRRLEAMGGREEVRDPATGAVVQEAVPPTNPTFAELHELRSLMRTNADFSRLNSDVRNGTFKHFNNVIDDVIDGIRNQPALTLDAHPQRLGMVPDMTQPPSYKIDVRGPQGDVAFRAQLNPIYGPDGRQAFHIQDIERVSDAYRGQGANVYRQLAQFAQQQGAELYSGYFPQNTSAGARHVQQRLQAAGAFDPATGRVLPGSGTSNLAAAAEALAQADAFYRKQIPIFNARQLNAVMRGVEAGEPANPIALYKTLVDANQPQMTARIRQLVGPNVWRAVQAAHIDDLMRRSMSKTAPGVVDGKAFARNVLEDHNSGVLGQVQDQGMTDQLMQQVRLLAMSRGEIPIPTNTGDRMLDIVAKARMAEEQAKQAAVTDPLRVLNQESRRIANEEQKALRAGRAERAAEPLGFLFDAKVGTQEAADRILNKPDLVLSVRDKFGPDSHEFKLVQQAYLWKVLQSDMDPGKQLYKIAPEIQHVLFPNQMLAQLQALAKDMDFLTDTKLMRGADQGAGQSMMATAKVEHPPLGSVRGIAKRVPGLGIATEFAARTMLEKFYGILASKTSQNPALFTYMLKGLRGTPEQREMTKTYINQVLLRGGVVGAGAGEGLYQNSGQ